jgi:hypothetical protein
MSDTEVLRILRSETTAVVLFVRLRNDERRAEYEKRKAEGLDNADLLI